MFIIMKDNFCICVSEPTIEPSCPYGLVSSQTQADRNKVVQMILK